MLEGGRTIRPVVEHPRMPLVLVVAAIASDAAGAHGLAFYLLLAAVVLTAHAALDAYGRLVDLPGDSPAVAPLRLQTALCSCSLALVLVAAAARAPALADGSVPAVGLSALVASFALLSLSGALRLLAAR